MVIIAISLCICTILTAISCLFITSTITVLQHKTTFTDLIYVNIHVFTPKLNNSQFFENKNGNYKRP